jgi:hypothetical protein
VIDFGALYPAAIDVRDDSGALVNPATATLTITLPDNSTVTPTIQLPPAVTGKLRYAYPTTQAGLHVARWVTTEPVAPYTDVFDVAPEIPPSIISLADAKQHLGMDPADTSEDDELRWWIAGTTAAVEDAKNEVIARRVITRTVRNERHRSLRLWNVPVISLDSLARKDGSHTWDVTSDVYTDPETGLVELISGPSLCGWLSYGITAGYQVIPYNLMQGSLVLLQHVWETQRGPGAIGGGVVGPEEAGDYKQAFMMPRKVREWIGPPRPVVA